MGYPFPEFSNILFWFVFFTLIFLSKLALFGSVGDGSRKV